MCLPLCLIQVLELCDQGDIKQALDKGTFHAPDSPNSSAASIYGSPRLNTSGLLLTLVEVASALSHLHSLGIVHCDIKVTQRRARDWSANGLSAASDSEM